ncbi:hypothetical protein TKK_0006724 [Trichogramma kaykai]|uniref:Protein kinase domain-containing protein n=1 Tax=Trichogramma kaykai TaxID=54128 RepID=A0ABD2XD32_9HYME
MIYNGTNHHQAPTLSSTNKSSGKHTKSRDARTTTSNSKSSKAARNAANNKQSANSNGVVDGPNNNRCRGRCRVQWSEKHVKEGLVLIQEAQLARVVKTGPINEYYDIEPKPFASGQWARVYKCKSRATGIVYAAKFSSRNRFGSDCSAELRHEIALLSLCSQSPRVVRLHDVYETPKEIIMVMEFAPGGDMQTLIDGDLVPLEGDVVHFVRQLVEGLAYLHERNIAHLDIKPQNVVMMGNFPDCSVKLCDFEISRVVLDGTEVREILGTPDYVAPEILHYEPITLAADMWSLGVTTYVLLSGFSPFGGETDQETFRNIMLGEVDFPEELFEDVSSQAKDFLAKLLVLEPSARMTAKQCLRHEWLRKAPTQASAHLRKYLSKSREVLLERVVSRENLRRAALLNQNTNDSNKSIGVSHEQQQQQPQQPHQQPPLESSQHTWTKSETCLNRNLAKSQGSLSLFGTDDYYESTGQRDLSSSRMSLADSLSSSKSNLATSQSCLLNKEQTEGLLHQAQDRNALRASMAQGLNRISVLSKIRGLSQVQSRSQACLPLLHDRLGIKDGDLRHQALNGNPLQCCNFDGSREKLYGLKSLSKSQGMLDIYRSLESLRRHRRELMHKKERSKTEDVLAIFRQLEHGSSSTSLTSESSSLATTTVQDLDDVVVNDNVEKVDESTLRKDKNVINDVKNNSLEIIQKLHGNDKKNEEAISNNGIDHQSNNDDKIIIETGPTSLNASEANLDSLLSIGSDTLTDDSEEIGKNKTPSSGSSECHGRDVESESENDEPKYTVAQLVSAFNKHQEVTSRTSLETIMNEKRVAEDSLNFPIGPKALRLFIPDIDISEKKPLVRRKTSYKPRKDWEELRKQNERNEALLTRACSIDIDNDEEDEGVNLNSDSLDVKPNDDDKVDENVSTDTRVTPPVSPTSVDSGVVDVPKIDSTDGTSPAVKESKDELPDTPTVKDNSSSKILSVSKKEDNKGSKSIDSKDSVKTNAKEITLKESNKRQSATSRPRGVTKKAESFKENSDNKTQQQQHPTRKAQSFQETDRPRTSSRVSSSITSSSTATSKRPFGSRATKDNRVCPSPYGVPRATADRIAKKSADKQPAPQTIRTRRTSTVTQQQQQP